MTIRFTTIALLASTLLACLSFAANTHEVRPALLSLQETSPDIFDVNWHRPVVGQRALPLEPLFPSDCVIIAAPGGALKHTSNGKVAVYRFVLDCTATPLYGHTIEIAGLDVSMTDTLLKIAFLERPGISAVVTASSPVYVIPLQASLMDTVGSYLLLGVDHIWSGWDHLLFILMLMMFIRSSKALVVTITGFTVAHSITLSAIALGAAAPAGALVELLIALSVLLLAYEARRAERSGPIQSFSARFPFAVASMFGLLHGFGFAGALLDIGLPADGLLVSLFTFNVGIELGQLAFVGVVAACSYFIYRWRRGFYSPSRAILQYTAGTLAVFMSIDRFSALW